MTFPYCRQAVGMTFPYCRQAVGMTTCNWTGGEEHLALRSTLVEQIHVVLDELEREVGAVPVRKSMCPQTHTVSRCGCKHLEFPSICPFILSSQTSIASNCTLAVRTYSDYIITIISFEAFIYFLPMGMLSLSCYL